MYGTIAKFQVKAGVTVEELRKLRDKFDQQRAPGHINTYMCQTDADPNVYYMVAIFESKEAYRANAQSPEQHERYAEYMALLDGEPEWSDGNFFGSS
jgi:quinol monooxygenase YgiN